ncbi:aminotransferase class I/II-fold pyridoxal phosphate-dependent enzyme [Halobacterium yunchengense]|uniref:aminotransferase class I/II-fold pyridoxal phosphate-dependent enzyme n=1 Tax=Halobacterium yunchengense TaxID=3108497 RepID=UPI0030096039
MDVDAFALERWFAEHEHGADVMLAESGVRSLPADRFDLDPGELGYVIPTKGGEAVREAVADDHGVTADEVVCTVGTQEANFLAFQSLLDADGHAVVVTPTYQSLHAVPDSICDVTRVPLDRPGDGATADDWTLDVDRVAAAVRDETDLVVVNNPNNPTGERHDWATVEALYDVAADGDAHLLCDEVYRLLADDPLPPATTLGDRAISTAGLSKAYGLAGLRFGWLAGPEPVVEAVERWKDYTTISPSAVGHHVASQVLTDADRDRELRREAVEHVRRNREITADWARDHGLAWPDPVGCNVFLRVPEGFADGREFCRTVVGDAGVVLAPGDCFSTGGESYDRYFRLGFGLPTDELREGLDRVAGVL